MNYSTFDGNKYSGWFDTVWIPRKYHNKIVAVRLRAKRKSRNKLAKLSRRKNR